MLDPRIAHALKISWVMVYTLIAVIGSLTLPFAHLVVMANLFLRGVPMLSIHTRRNRVPTVAMIGVWVELLMLAWLPLLLREASVGWQIWARLDDPASVILVVMAIGMAPITALLIPRAWQHEEELTCGHCGARLDLVAVERAPPKIAPVAQVVPSRAPAHHARDLQRPLQ